MFVIVIFVVEVALKLVVKFVELLVPSARRGVVSATASISESASTVVINTVPIPFLISIFITYGIKYYNIRNPLKDYDE
ncbi:hypothetical protein GCM10007112_19300 [Vulcanisaeta souniana JCM 11219]|uniref:Uncharacterized protein n=1 Tax=Vulcanisaeta souniana JCM 11219 TaxID=1293586 RepID=A0A830EH83_9CREN|nr:hypothetical protein GCM10007112_19300 [Vulcanisaeta souniana JCM 11219]